MTRKPSFLLFRSFKFTLLGALLWSGGAGLTLGATDIPPHLGRKDDPYYSDYRPHGLPFVEAVVDLRGLAPAGNVDNLVPRGLILPLADDVFVCFDTELLRVAAIWTGDYLTEGSMAARSYGKPLKKIPAGQGQLSQPLGPIVAATGLYPGWQDSGRVEFADPRSRGLDPDELGRGPLAEAEGRWQGVAVDDGEAVLHYTVQGSVVRERFGLDVNASGERRVRREIEVEGGATRLTTVLAETADGAAAPVAVEGDARRRVTDGRHVLAEWAEATAGDRTARVFYALPVKTANPAGGAAPSGFVDDAVVETQIVVGDPQGAYAVDELEIPYPNPWHRRIRPVDIDFWADGRAAVLTFDGDVYLLEGLAEETGRVRWRRVAYGFNEPQALRIRDGEIFVFSRLGITRLVDRDGDGAADYHAMFCNLMVQSAETRGYPASMVLNPDGSFLVTMGGIQASTPAPHAGRALHIAADGRAMSMWADGLRNAYLSRDPVSGLVTASDQQGNWVPATPLHLIRHGGYYGFEPGTTEPREVAEVPLWIPHRVVQSGIDQVWGADRRLGALAGSLLYVDYYRPRLVKVLVQPDAATGGLAAAAVPLPVTFEVPLLKGEINPVDGSAWFAGMQIWGSLAPRVEGLSRLRAVADVDTLPVAASLHREGVWLRFGTTLPADGSAEDAANYAIKAWNYQRSEKYGSAQYRLDGEPGVTALPVRAVLVAADRRSVFLASPDFPAAQQVEASYRWDDAEEATPVYFTASSVPPEFDAVAAGFGEIDWAAVLTTAPVVESTIDEGAVISVARGQELATLFGCVGCHSLDGTTEGKSGPTWKNLYGAERPLANGDEVLADAAYLEEAILNPTAKIVRGYNPDEAGMPPYAGILSDADVASLVAFIHSLSDSPE